MKRAPVPAEIQIELLPHSVQRLIRAWDVPRALQLLRAHGGLPLKIPMTPAGWLADAFGAEAVAALIAEFGAGERLVLPMPDKLEQQLRDPQIRADLDAGVSSWELALRYGLTLRQIYNIRKRGLKHTHAGHMRLLQQELGLSGGGQ